MACTEITNAIEWAKSSTDVEGHPVQAFFTRHFGSGGAEPPSMTDGCWYAYGRVFHVASNPQIVPPWNGEHLRGELTAYLNRGGTDKLEMKLLPTTKIKVWIWADGRLAWQQLLKGKPVGGMPPTVVQGDCLGSQLLTAVAVNDTASVGVRILGPEKEVPS